MASTIRPTNRNKDPNWISVQLNVRMPFWYRAQLEHTADEEHMTTNQLILEALEKAYKPVAPK